MILAEVVGPVVCTVKHPAFEGEKLLAVQPVDDKGRGVGTTILAIDRAQAGVGDKVLVLREGSGIRQIKGRDAGLNVAEAVVQAVPVRSMIVGIVDAVEIAAKPRKAGRKKPTSTAAASAPTPSASGTDAAEVTS